MLELQSLNEKDHKIEVSLSYIAHPGLHVKILSKFLKIIFLLFSFRLLIIKLCKLLAINFVSRK